jgi:3-deoxy-D-manno-octulosonic-acid transferase
MGGSFVEKGGHNILEVAQLGKAVVFGPDMRSFEDEASIFIESNAGIQCKKEELPVYLNQLILDNNYKMTIENNTDSLIKSYKNIFNNYYKIVFQYTK